MKRAIELFTFDRRSAGSPMIEKAWQTRSEPEESFISVAVSHWEMVVTRQDDSARLTVRGPETRATMATIPKDAAFFGLQFSLGTFMPKLPPARLVDGALTLSKATQRSFWLDGYRFELPGPDNVDAFVEKLVRHGLLVHDEVASSALKGDVERLSTRALERRVSRATGLTRGTIRQIDRAEHAVELLTRGMAPLDVAHQAGYSDQPHLTRSLRRFIGQTPSQIAIATVAG
jgi:hypothetical protein